MNGPCFWKRAFTFAFAFLLAAMAWVRPVSALTEEQKFFNEVWRIVNQAYLDETFNHQNWWWVRERGLKGSFVDRDRTYEAIRDMLASLDDPFTRLLEPERYRNLQTSTSGELIGIGVQIASDPETGRIVVVSPLAGSPAEEVGILAGEFIVEVNGQPTTPMSLDEAAENMRGNVGTSVALTVEKRSGDRQTFTLTRKRIELDPVVTDLREESGGLKVGYIRLSHFNGNAASSLKSGIKDLESRGASAFILDLRHNPGGLLQAGIEIARQWLDEGTIVYTVNRQGVFDSFEAYGQALTDAPLVVLIDRGTASASEILAGALQDNHRAVLVGERSFGKGLIQSLFDLSDGSGLAVTVAKYETPNHRDINRAGIVPDIEVRSGNLPPAKASLNRDPQYRAAVDWLNQHRQSIASKPQQISLVPLPEGMVAGY